MKSVEVRQQLVEALRLDLIGPDLARNLGTPDEVLPQWPSRWYLSGFLVPLDAPEEQRAEEGSDDDLDEMSEAGGADDATTPEPAAARRAYMPSSIGLSVLVSASTRQLAVTVRWGDYKRMVSGQMPAAETEEVPPSTKEATETWQSATTWQRTAREEQITLALPDRTTLPVEQEVPSSGGLRLCSWSDRSRAMGPKVGCRKGPAPPRSSSSIAAIPVPTRLATRRSHSRPNWKSPARSHWCRGPTCGASRAKTRTIAWPTSSTAMSSSTRWATIRPPRQ